METDKVIETSINRNSKTPGGQTGETDFNEPSLVCLNNLHRVSIAKRLFWPYFFSDGDIVIILLLSSTFRATAFTV